MTPNIIFYGYVPDINSGGNSMIPFIIKEMNSLFDTPRVFFYIQFNKNYSNMDNMYQDMIQYEQPYLPIATRKMVQDKNNIVIYPEASGNPLNFKNIVRFNFYFNIYIPSDNEYTIFFASPFKRLFNQVREMYKIPTYNLNENKIYSKYINCFYNLNDMLSKCTDFGWNREEACYTVRKGPLHPHSRKTYTYHPADAFNITHENSNMNDLIIIFNKYKYFYSYDGFTNMLQMASMCGCIPIIVPFGNFISINDFWEEEWFTNGIAYGNSNEAIQHAIDTKQNMIDALIKQNKVDYKILFKDVIDNIYDNFNKNITSNITTYQTYNLPEKLLKPLENEILIYVYILKEYINNNKILILTDKITNIDPADFILTYSNDYNMIDDDIYNFIFTDKPLNETFSQKYRFKTHFFINLKRTNDTNYTTIRLQNYKFIEPKYINSNLLKTTVNLENTIYKISNDIYNYRPNYGTSKIIWAPSWNNISNSHIIIKTINEIGFKHYKRKTNLVDVVPTNDNNMINKFSKDINNPLNICIYQENNGNLLNMIKKVYFNWFFDSFRNKIEYDNDALFIYQYPFYSIKENILRQRYDLPIDINHTHEYPNCFQLSFNINILKSILLNNKNINMKRNKTCYVLRKTADTHPLKMMDKIADYFIHPSDSISIENYSLQESIDLFSQCSKFYCYDNVSFLAPIAVCCGCTPILCNKYPGFSDIKELYEYYCPWMFYGMAYDDTPEEITKAINTRQKLYDVINIIDKNSSVYFSENSMYEPILQLLKYLECYFCVSFNEK